MKRLRSATTGGGQEHVPITDEIKPGSKNWSAVLTSLRNIPFCTDLGKLELNVLVHELTLCRYAKGEAVVTEGDEADALYQVHAGAACVEVGGEVVMSYTAGGFFGELALLSADSTKRNATVVATEKGTQCLRMSITAFQHLQSITAKDEEDAATEEEAVDTSAADAAAAAEEQEQPNGAPGAFSQGHRAALRKCSALRAELAASQRSLRDQGQELVIEREEARRKHDELHECLREMDGELQAAAFLARQLEGQNQSAVTAAAGLEHAHVVISETADELEVEVNGSEYMVDVASRVVFGLSAAADGTEVGRWDASSRRIVFSAGQRPASTAAAAVEAEGDSSVAERRMVELEAQLQRTQVELERRVAADDAKEAEVAQVRAQIEAAWPGCADDVRAKLRGQAPTVAAEGVPPFDPRSTVR